MEHFERVLQNCARSGHWAGGGVEDENAYFEVFGACDPIWTPGSLVGRLWAWGADRAGQVRFGRYARDWTQG